MKSKLTRCGEFPFRRCETPRRVQLISQSKRRADPSRRTLSLLSLCLSLFLSIDIGGCAGRTAAQTTPMHYFLTHLKGCTAVRPTPEKKLIEFLHTHKKKQKNSCVRAKDSARAVGLIFRTGPGRPTAVNTPNSHTEESKYPH